MKSLKSLIVVVVVTVVALAFSGFASADSVELYTYPAMYLCGWLALVINWLAFIPSALAKSDKFYDTTGAITYLTVTGVAVFAAYQSFGSFDPRGIAVAAMVAIWCIRLGKFLFIRIHAAGGSDSR